VIAKSCFIKSFHGLKLVSAADTVAVNKTRARGVAAIALAVENQFRAQTRRRLRATERPEVRVPELKKEQRQ
jgi:hypothetical protein